MSVNTVLPNLSTLFYYVLKWNLFSLVFLFIGLFLPPFLSFSAYNEKVVSFLRQSTITEILKEKYPKYLSNARLRDKISKIRTEGTDALEFMSNDLDLNLLLRYVSQSVVILLAVAMWNI